MATVNDDGYGVHTPVVDHDVVPRKAWLGWAGISSSFNDSPGIQQVRDVAKNRIKD